MRNRDLIKELLEYDLNAEVTIETSINNTAKIDVVYGRVLSGTNKQISIVADEKQQRRANK